MGAAALRQSRWKDVSDRRDIGPLSKRHLAFTTMGSPNAFLIPCSLGIFSSVFNNFRGRGTLSLSLSLCSSLHLTIGIRRQRRIREIDRLRTGKMIAARSPLKSINARNHFPFSLSIDSRRVRARYRRRDKGSASRRVTL